MQLRFLLWEEKFLNKKYLVKNFKFFECIIEFRTNKPGFYININSLQKSYQILTVLNKMSLTDMLGYIKFYHKFNIPSHPKTIMEQ